MGKTLAVEVDQNVDTLAQILTNATLGEYDIYFELGRGGMAAVYLALDLALNRKVAIKTMLAELVAREGMVQRFKREAQTAAGLSHPHIIQIFTVKETKELVYFVMKFIEGRSLESVIMDRGKVDVHMAQVILSQVAGALAYAHRKHVVHRDIKPANIMIDEDGWAIVTDFGIAKVQDVQNLTATGTAIGTPHYMSPEQFHNKAITGASDQYSLGVVAYEMLVGKKPFDGATYAEIITQHLFEPVPDIHAARPDLPDSLANAIKRMLSKEPGDRFPDLDAAATALGVPQKTEGDVVRTQMISLAKSGPQKKLRMSVPMSPIPVTKRQAPPPDATVIEGRRPRPNVKASRSSGNIRMLAAAVAFVVVGAGGFLGWRAMKSDNKAPTPAVVVPSGTTTQVPAVDSTTATQPTAKGDSQPPENVAEQPTTPEVKPPPRAQSTKAPVSASKTAPVTKAPVRDRPVSPTQRAAVGPSQTQGLSTLRLILSPPASVAVDGLDKGEQSRIQEEVLPGTHTLRVSRNGFAPKDTVFTIGAGQTATIRIQLTPRP
ncbi:MAG TPA: protein kinase [Gemmatimonadaceae bacterium]|nr:protein kinase [Gemmatimonadaceae bacterium]